MAKLRILVVMSVLAIAVLGDPITRRQSFRGDCICSDFTFFNPEGLMVGNCNVGIRPSRPPFCYVHLSSRTPRIRFPFAPRFRTFSRCPDLVESDTFPGMFVSEIACQNREVLLTRQSQSHYQGQQVQQQFVQQHQHQEEETNYVLMPEATTTSTGEQYQNAQSEEERVVIVPMVEDSAPQQTTSHQSVDY